MSKKTKADPTGQAGNRKRSARRLSSRLVIAEREVRALFKNIPRKRKTTKVVVNQTEAFYEYDLTPEQQEELAKLIEFINNAQLLETQTDVLQPNWFWNKDAEQPYRTGTLEETRDFTQLVSAAVLAGVVTLAIPLESVGSQQILFSEPYRQGLKQAQVHSFNSIKNLSKRVSAQVMQVITAGVESGKSPTEISKEITTRYRVARSSAKRIAETEVNKAYNDAKLNTTEALGEQTGLESGVVHISALLPTTRAEHAARHGNAYSVRNQMQWWNTGSNRINCKCTTRSVLINRKGEVIDV